MSVLSEAGPKVNYPNPASLPSGFSLVLGLLLLSEDMETVNTNNSLDCMGRTWEDGKFMNTQIQVETGIQNQDCYEEISPAFMIFAHRAGGKWYFCSDGQGRVLAFLCVLLYNPKYCLSSCLSPPAFEGRESF